MRIFLWGFAILLTSAGGLWAAGRAADSSRWQQRRQRAAVAFSDGVLLVHAEVPGDLASDGFRQDPIFYYFTGLENTADAVLAIDGPSKESWLFLSPAVPSPFSFLGLKPEVLPGPETVKRLGVDHAVDWSELENFLAQRAASPTRLYVAPGISSGMNMPASVTGFSAPHIPLWIQAIKQKWPSFELVEADEKVSDLLTVQDPEEIAALRAAAKASVAAVLAGMRAVRPGKTQRSVEGAVVQACWDAGAHGAAFWPWAMSGANGVFPTPFASLARYDHLNAVMAAGDLVRLDIGCEWDHYQGDLGRTIPVSGHFTDEQREVWNIFIAAYQAGSKSLRARATRDQVFEVWRAELLRHKDSTKSDLARRAIEEWSQREKVPFWQIHAINLVEGNISGPLKENTTLAFEPIVSIGGQGYYLEDMFVITKDGVELLTPGVPYSAEEIEAAMK